MMRLPNAIQRRNPTRRRAGFALIVVLGGLAVLTSLFTLSSQALITQGLNDRATRILAQRPYETAERMDLVLALGPDKAVKTAQFRLVDVGGLIDLNTADPRLIARLIQDLGLPPTAMEHYRNWRRQALRFQRLEDFLRVVGAPATDLPKLYSRATVHSFRRGIAPDIAPDPVLKLVTGLGGDQPGLMRGPLRNHVPDFYVSDPTNSTYRVWLRGPEGERVLGGVQLTQDPNHRRILWLN